MGLETRPSIVVHRRDHGSAKEPPFQLRAESVDEKILRAIRENVPPEFGSLVIRLEVRDGRLKDLVVVTGEKRIRLE